jgi:hypothetical protein
MPGIDALAHGSGIASATAISEQAAQTLKNRRAGELAEMGVGGPIANHLQDSRKFDEIIKLMIDRNVRLEPNIVVTFNRVYPQSARFHQEDELLLLQTSLRIPPSYIRSWTAEAQFRKPPSPELLTKMKTGLANHQLFARKFVAAGGKILVGTDSNVFVVPGRAVWHEMELLADAGIPPLAILQGATMNPAEFVHQDNNLGTIEPGKLADIIILGLNPLQDVRNVRSLEAVIQHGKLQKLGYSYTQRNPIPRPYFATSGQLPRPYITSITPVAVPMGSGPFLLTIRGRDFNKANRVLWDNIDLEVAKFSSTEVQVVVPADLLRQVGAYKVHMMTGGREAEENYEFRQEESYNYQNVLVTFGAKFNERWNGSTRTNEF